VEASDNLGSFEKKLKDQTENANKLYADALTLKKQWENASKDFDCGAPPGVNHAESVCSDGNTVTSVKCDITCKSGYDGKGTKNTYRCRKQGKFGKQIYGELLGAATCVGRNFGKPTTIAKAKSVGSQIRYPHKASYTCYEGFSMDETATGDKAFEVPCGTNGDFEVDSSTHVCKAVTCNSAPIVKNSDDVTGTFFYTDVANYKCKTGFTVDGTPGGIIKFSTSCQSTGVFSQALTCNAVRCGSPNTYSNTELVTGEACDWASHVGKYSGGYAGGVSTRFSIADAKVKCVQLGEGVCKGVTCLPDGTCTVRKSSTLSASPSGETTHVPCFEGTKLFEDEVQYKCESGYSYDQQAFGQK